MNGLFGFSVLEVVLIVALTICLVSLAAVTSSLIQLRRHNVHLRRLVATRRRRPALERAGRAVRVVTETAVRMRDSGVGGLLTSSIEEFMGWMIADRPEIKKVARPDGSVTIFFSDIEDSTALNENLGDKAWVKLLAKHDAVIRSKVAQHHGHIVKSQGDGFMVVFGDPEAAIFAGIAIQQAFELGGGLHLRRTPISVRMGIHLGSAIEKDGDYFGRNVAMAARVASLADGGEILVSDDVRIDLGEDERITLEEIGAVDLKGFSGTHALWRVEFAL